MKHDKDSDPRVSQGDGGDDANATPGASSSHEAFAHAAAQDPEAAPSGGAGAVPAWMAEPCLVPVPGNVQPKRQKRTSRAPTRVSLANDGTAHARASSLRRSFAPGSAAQRCSSASSRASHRASFANDAVFGAVPGGVAFGVAADAISASEAGDARGGGAHVTSTEGRLLVLSELNSVLIWRAFNAGSGLTGGETIETPNGQKITMFVRPGAEGLVASLLQEPRCEFAFVSGMGEKYCLPIAERLLQRVAPDGEWVLDQHGAAPCWVSTGYPRARVYVLGQPRGAEGETQGGEYVVKDLNQVWAALHECGCGWYTEQNTWLLDAERQNASHPDCVWEVRRWKPLAEGAEDPNPVDPELGRRLLAFLERATVWGPYQWVTDLEEARHYMEQLRVDLRARPILGVDVECHYRVVCVVQLASWRRGLVLDALALEAHAMGELLQPLLGDEWVSKLFHGCFNKISCLKAAFRVVVNPPIFDTAATACEDLDGMRKDGQTSLQTLCRQYLSYELDKTYQTANWRQRPMPEEMLQYAATDAQVLLPLHAAIETWRFITWQDEFLQV